jgi:hypothetical protein
VEEMLTKVPRMQKHFKHWLDKLPTGL